MIEEYSELELKKMTDRDIKEHFLVLRSCIIRMNQKKFDTKELEIYYCYVYKEIQNRNKM